MNRLLAANRMRLKRSRSFRWGMILMFVYGVLLVLTQVMWYSAERRSIDPILHGFVYPTVFLMPVFCSLFIGSDYSNGTVRNKIIVGNTRREIYSADLLTGIGVSFAFCGSALLPVLAFGLPILGLPGAGADVVCLSILACFFLAASLTSVFTLVIRLCANQAVSVILCFGLMILLFVIAEPYCDDLFCAENRIQSKAMYGGGSGIYPEISDTELWFLRRVADLLPTGQIIQFISLKCVRLWEKMLWSLLLVLFTTAVGIWRFKKKDLK